MASSVLLYKKDSACWWASPNPPRTVLRTGCAPEESDTFYGRRFAAIKKRADSSLMTATCPLIIDISLSCFLLFSSLLLIDLQEPVDVLLCDLVVHHLLLDRAILLIKLSLFCKDAAILG